MHGRLHPGAEAEYIPCPGTLRCCKVPEDEIEKVLSYIVGLDMRSLAQSVMEELFEKLAMRYEFSPEGLIP